MAFQMLDVVVLTRDIPEHGLKSGDKGTVIYVHSSDAVCVEFTDDSGGTIAVADIYSADIRQA